MGDTTSGRRVLVIGLDPQRVPGPWDPRPVVEAIERGLAELARHGYDAEPCLVGLDGSDDVSARIAAAVRSGPWDCVLIGGGLRHDDDLAEVLESAVHLVRVHAPGAAIAFNSSPADLLAAVERAVARA